MPQLGVAVCLLELRCDVENSKPDIERNLKENGNNIVDDHVITFLFQIEKMCY